MAINEPEEPSRKKKKRRKARRGAGLWIGLGLGSALLLTGAILFMTKRPKEPVILPAGPVIDTTASVLNLGAVLTSGNLKRLNAEMGRDEVVAIFGPAQSQITGADISQRLLENDSFRDAYQDEINAYRKSGELLAYLHNGAALLVGIGGPDGSPEEQGKVVHAWFCTRQGGNLIYEVLERKGGRLVYSKKAYPYP